MQDVQSLKFSLLYKFKTGSLTETELEHGISLIAAMSKKEVMSKIFNKANNVINEQDRVIEIFSKTQRP